MPHPGDIEIQCGKECDKAPTYTQPVILQIKIFAATLNAKAAEGQHEGVKDKKYRKPDAVHIAIEPGV
jgi:hypothetical protein